MECTIQIMSMCLIGTPYKLLKIGKRIQGKPFIYSNNPLTAVQQHSDISLFLLERSPSCFVVVARTLA